MLFADCFGCMDKLYVFVAGYYSRQAALRLLLKQFLEITHSKQSGPTQILSLGAGFDTTWFQLQVLLSSRSVKLCASDVS
jgi:hypothetical protein